VYTPLASPQYPRAPITEAVIEVRVAAEIDANILDKIARKLKSHYTRSEPLRQVGVAIDNTGGNVSIQQNATGFRLSNEDQADIALLSNRFITTARLPPYPGWDRFRDRAKENWAMWRSLAPAHAIARAGVRYINRIDIPATPEGKLNLEEYFNFHPQAEVFEATLVTYLAQVRFLTYRPNWAATITTTPMLPNPVPDAASVMLDIDVFREADLPLHPDKLWSLIDEARSVKNDLFERALTPKTKALFT
jgi:uncharacterized protein (TIGR04255 family)